MQAHTYPNVPFDSAVESLKTPPFSKEAEQSVLGGLMLNNEAWISIADLLTEKDFHLQAHQILFRAIKSLSEEGHPCDPITLSEWLQKHNQLEAIGGAAYLGLLANNTPSAANIIAYAEIVRERSILRQLMRVGSDIAEAALNTQGRTTTELLDQAEKKVFEIAEFGSRNQNGFVQLKDIVETTFERIDMLSQQEGMLTGIATGFTDLDVQTAGLQKSDLVIVAGRPSMGKTSFAMNIAEHVAVKEQLPVAVFSMEMSNEQLAMRLISSLAAVNLQSVRTGSLTDDDWPKIINAVSQLSEAPLFIDDTPALSPIELRSRARRLAREKGQLGLIVVDYLQLMQIPGNKENRVNEVSEIARSLKSLAKEVNVPVMALSQLNRSLEQRTNKHPVMSDLRESGEIEQSADLIVFIYRDEVYNEDSADKGIAEIIIGKQRNGPIGIVRLAFQGHLTQFKNYIPEDSFHGE
ncbi:MAG: replicative DNA helicase [Gammaproteobacteria bacterium]|nr:MAG: replicative DNA helicase [Gammaproteobacteria bacterium]RKZ44505.1 MAG: replicative DNA helicase [Gammaproteobacteria bacterium]RKZ74493.1 MAG: replicative DNA helicase [Gammaproteobacteria bacterium]